MAEMLQKGFSSISDLLYDHLGFSNDDFINNGDRLNKFINYFGRLRSKHDEQVLALSEIKKSKLIFNQPSITMTKKHNELILLSFLHSIGYDVSFAFIHAVNMAQQGELMTKKSGYLLCSLFFDDSHQFSLLLVNTILKDLQNSNVSNECAALTATSQLVASNNFPTILPYVVKKLTHKVALSRKKALQCLYTFVLKDPSLMAHVEPHLPNSLKDSDPGVVWVAVEIYMLAGKHSSSYGHLVAPVQRMVGMIVEGRCSEAYDYHGNPSPWLLMSLVRFLGLLCSGCQRSTNETSILFLKLLKQTKTNHRVGFALLYEVIRCISKLDVISEELFDQSHECVQLFLSARSFYLKLSGIRLLTMLIPRKTSSALQFQSAILEVLRCSDPSLQRAVVDLLFVMANQLNKDFVCQKILEQATGMEDKEMKKIVYQNLLDLSLRFSKDDAFWSISVVFQVIEKADEDDINLDFESDIYLECLTDRDDDEMLEAKMKAVELAEEKLKHIQSSKRISYLSLQLLKKFEKFSKTSPEDFVLTLLKMLPSLVDDKMMTVEISSLIGCLLHKISNNDILISVNDLLNHILRVSIHSHIRLSLIELQVQVLCLQGDSSLNLNPNIEKSNQPSDAFLNMEMYISHYLERGGVPYNRPELEGVSSLPTQKLGEESENVWGLEVESFNIHEDSTRKEKKLKFLRNNSDTVWSKSGYKQESTEFNQEPNNTKLQVDQLSCKLFQGFSRE